MPINRCDEMGWDCIFLLKHIAVFWNILNDIFILRRFKLDSEIYTIERRNGKPHLRLNFFWAKYNDSTKTKSTAIPANNLLALHKQYTDCPTKTSGYEVGNLYKSLLFIRNIL